MSAWRDSIARGMKRSASGFAEMLGNLILTITAAIGVGVLLLIPFFKNSTVDATIYDFAAAIAIGIVAGFFSRVLLSERTPLLRLISAWIATIAGMVTTAMITNGVIGLATFERSFTDWYALSQVAVSALAAALALSAFQKKNNTWDGNFSAQDADYDHGSYTLPEASTGEITPRFQHRRTGNRVVSGSVKVKTKKSKALLKKSSGRIVTGSRKRSRRKKVTLNGFEERRCPYCLEPVLPHDKRGVVVCPICKAYHHKDCWDITGRCQVPHDNA